MFCHRGQNFVEPVVVFLERFSQHRKPLVHCFNPGLGQTTRALGALDATDNESRVFEYFEVLRDCGCVIAKGSASSMTVASPLASRERIARRVGSPRAEKAASRLVISCNLYK